jgi:hypothetical protein
MVSGIEIKEVAKEYIYSFRIKVNNKKEGTHFPHTQVAGHLTVMYA